MTQVCPCPGYANWASSRKNSYTAGSNSSPGQSAVEYIRSIRLKKAALLLQSGNFTISEVMYNVGFSNASYFTRAFSSAFGMTPSEYLKSFKNK